jgi:hypothetical protein
VRLRVTAVLFLIVLVVTVVVVSRSAIKNSSPDELVQLCLKSVSECDWLSYQEDIKGSIGAQAVANWDGIPVEVRQEGPEVTVIFSLKPPWSDYEAAVPVLLRDPMGRQYPQKTTTREGNRRKYLFCLDTASAASPLPWIEIRYPHSERRIGLDKSGAWQDTPAR